MSGKSRRANAANAHASGARAREGNGRPIWVDVIGIVLGIGGWATAGATLYIHRSDRPLNVTDKYYEWLRRDIDVHHHNKGDERNCRNYVAISSKLDNSISDLPRLTERVEDQRSSSPERLGALPQLVRPNLPELGRAQVDAIQFAGHSTEANHTGVPDLSGGPLRGEDFVRREGGPRFTEPGDPIPQLPVPDDPNSTSPTEPDGSATNPTIVGLAKAPGLPSDDGKSLLDSRSDEWIDHESIVHGLHVQRRDNESGSEFAVRQAQLDEMLRADNYPDNANSPAPAAGGSSHHMGG